MPGGRRGVTIRFYLNRHTLNDIAQPSRFLPFDGSINFRDFGGYRAQDGRPVRWGRLFRCGALSNLTENDHRRFADLEIGVICDLRRPDEVELHPTPEHPPFDCRQHIPIEPGSSMMLRESLQKPDHGARERIDFMVSITREIARDHHDAYRRLFEHLLATDGGFLLHCSAGKDRTGFGAALILSAVGVDEETIVEDYLLTNQAECLFRFMGERMKSNRDYRIDDESIEAITGVREEYLRAALDEVRQRHGSVEGYLEEIGVDAEARAELRHKLLD